MQPPDFASSVRTISYASGGHPVETTAAAALSALLGVGATESSTRPEPGVRVGLAGGAWKLGPPEHIRPSSPWMWARLAPDGTGELTASQPALLYALVKLLADGLTNGQRKALASGLLLKATFDWNRPVYDSVLTQVARTSRGFNPEAYVARLAECGFTHLEVNGLAFHIPFEPGVPGEYYSQFYSYGPGLMQFVESTLTRGLYPREYLSANLNRLKRMADLGRKYGLKPGLLSYEPRTLPEHFFQRYPTLRGARVDHPLRSHVPRYTLAQDHPVSRDYYQQLVRNLMKEVPDLAYLSVWTNDSGAGFEHTASLYVGRNGGPYLIREWRNHEQIAEAAGKSAARWLRLIREAAAETNPEFVVSLRIEPFKVEHDVITAGMGDGVTFEAPSLLVRGWDLPYHHPQYPEQVGAAGTIFHVDMDPAERDMLARYRAGGIEPKVSYSASSSFNMEPLLGTPFPRMLYRKLTSLREMDVRRVSALGGLLDVEKTPYWPNPEVIRSVQLNPDEPVDDLLMRLATRWAGAEHAGALVELWDAVDEAVSVTPMLYLYSNFGFVWYRAWVRPLVPDIEAIPAEERRYYERFMVTMANNPNNNDLGRDVLFEIISRDAGRKMADAFDREVTPRLDAALEKARAQAETSTGPAPQVFEDLYYRIRALRCWTTTQRNTCAWVAGVYTYLESSDEKVRGEARAYVQDMIDRDLANTRDLLDLWENSPVEFILVSEVGETSFVYGENLSELLRRKIELTEQYRDRAPRIDRDILWRIE